MFKYHFFPSSSPQEGKRSRGNKLKNKKQTHPPCPPRSSFCLDLAVVRTSLAQNRGIPDLATKLEETNKDLDARKKPPS